MSEQAHDIDTIARNRPTKIFGRHFLTPPVKHQTSLIYYLKSWILLEMTDFCTVSIFYLVQGIPLSFAQEQKLGAQAR